MGCTASVVNLSASKTPEISPLGNINKVQLPVKILINSMDGYVYQSNSLFNQNTAKISLPVKTVMNKIISRRIEDCLLYTSPSPRDGLLSRMPSSA